MADQADPIPDARRQLAGFSIFVESPDDGGSTQVRLYHEESGEEEVLSGADAAAWADWLVDHVPDDVEQPRRRRIDVDLVDVDVTCQSDLRIELRVVVNGMARELRRRVATAVREALEG